MENIDNFFQKYTFSKTKSPQNTDESFSPFKLKKLIKNSHFVPQEFNKIYEQIKQYRLLHNQTPVDLYGAQNQGDKSLPLNDYLFQILLSILLSVQTKDEITNQVMQKVIKQQLTIEKVASTSEETILNIIQEVNFNKKKATQIKNLAIQIKEKHSGNIPNKYEDLIKFKGVGPKVAHLFLQIAFNQTQGIAVDTHMHRISNRLQWVQTKTPEQTRVELEKIVPIQLWSEVNGILVGFGQSVCKPIGPLCSECVIKDVCVYNLNKK